MAIFLLGPDPNGSCCGCENRPTPCTPCSGIQVSGCGCYYTIPYTGTFDSVNLLLTGNSSSCYSYSPLYYDTVNSSGDYTINTYSIDFSTINEISATINIDNNTSNPPLTNFAAGDIEAIDNYSISVENSCSLTVNYNISISTADSLKGIVFTTTIMDCSGIQSIYQIIESDETSSLIGNYTYPALDAGTYLFSVETSCAANTPGTPSTSGPINMSAFYSFSANTDMIPNPIVSNYTLTGSQIQIQACPKLVLPETLTPAANLTDAQNIIDTRTSNCISSILSTDSGRTFSATDNITSFDFTCSAHIVGALESSIIYSCCNGRYNKKFTLNWTFSYNSATPSSSAAYQIDFSIYYYKIERSEFNDKPIQYTFFNNYSSSYITIAPGSNSVNGTITSDNLPNDNAYVLIASYSQQVGIADANVTFAGSITSDGDFSVNPITVLYTNDTTCPSRLDCTP